MMSWTERESIDLSKEDDVHRINQRRKQLEIGKNTIAYDVYIRTVPKSERDPRRRTTDHPVTPDPERKVSHCFNPWT